MPCCIFTVLTLALINVQSYRSEMTFLFSTPLLPDILPTTDHTTTKISSFPAEYMINSDFCKAMRSCETSDPFLHEKSCYCDEMCTIFVDCCSDYTPENRRLLTQPENRRLLAPSQFSCVSGFTEVETDHDGIYMVTACSPNWKNEITQRLCESRNDDILTTLPVSDSEDYFVAYKNMYCAQCNFVYNFKYWEIYIKCRDDTKTDCKRKYIPALNTVRRKCVSYRKNKIVSTCLPDAHDEVKSKCTSGNFSATFDRNGIVYRNEHCASCNGVNVMFCKATSSDFTTYATPSTLTTTPTPPGATGVPAYSYRLLVDFNTAYDFAGRITCEDSERFDRIAQVCRKIYCAPPAVAIQGLCVLDTMTSTASYENDTEESSGAYKNRTEISGANCTLVKLYPSEYQLRNDSHILVYSQQRVYDARDITKIGTDIFICLEKVNLRNVIFTAIESYLSLIGMVISIASLLFTLIVYLSLPNLLNVPGKNLMCLVGSLLAAQILFLLSVRVESINWLCKLTGILLHYLFLAVFSWMNIIAFDLIRTFSNQFALFSSKNNSSSKRFKSYSLYAWIVPAVIVAVAVIIDLSPMKEDVNKFKPDYGNGICWITSNVALIIFFAGPLALFKLFDIVAFIVTVWFITKARRHGARASKKKDACSLVIHLKLSLILGLTWVFAFVANIANDNIVWYLFIILNSLQGLYIAVCFTCTKRVWKMLNDQWKKRQKLTTSSFNDKNSSSAVTTVTTVTRL